MACSRVDPQLQVLVERIDNESLNVTQAAARKGVKLQRIPTFDCRWRHPYLPGGGTDPRLAGGPVKPTMEPRCEEAVERWVAAAPRLSQKQQDIVAAVFRGVITNATERRRRGGAA